MNAGCRYCTPVLVLAAGLGLTPQAEAAKEKFVRSKPHVNIGTVGHASATETAVVFLRTAVPSADPSSAPPCDGVEGELVVYEPGAADPGRTTGPAAVRELVETQRHAVSLAGPGEIFSVELGPGSGGGLRRVTTLDFRFDDPDAARRCGLETSVQVHDSSSGETRTVHFKGYRPQFYLRTSD
jgi:hypothetical protein